MPNRAPKSRARSKILRF